MAEMPANAPQTDREWLTRIDSKLDNLIERIEGKDGQGGIYQLLQKQELKIEACESSITKLWNWRHYTLALLMLILLLITGRYFFGPTQLPI